jgi:AraC family transcriptional regulator, positive regulator of tynA and feaB
MSVLQLASTAVADGPEVCWGPRGRFHGRLYTSARSTVSFSYSSIADVALCRFRADGSYRTEPDGSRHLGRYVGLVLQLKETIRYETVSGHKIVIQPHHWILVDQNETPASVGTSGTDCLIIMVPRARLMGRGNLASEATLRPVSGGRGISKLMWQSICSVYRELPNVGPRFEPGVVDTITQWLRLAIAESFNARDGYSREAVLRERVKAYVLQHLREPELTTDRIAAELHCTKRYLHKVFESEELSVCDYIWRMRVDRCREELLSPTSKQKSITEIAFSWGFNSSGHFSSVFKDRFGTTPGMCREEYLSGNWRDRRDSKCDWEDGRDVVV